MLAFGKDVLFLSSMLIWELSKRSRQTATGKGKVVVKRPYLCKKTPAVVSACLLLQDECLKARNKSIPSAAMKQPGCCSVFVVNSCGRDLQQVGPYKPMPCLINRTLSADNGDSAVLLWCLRINKTRGKPRHLFSTIPVTPCLLPPQ